MPVAFACTGAHPRRVPLVADPFRLGRGRDADLVVEDERAAALHAEVRLRKGEYLLGGSRGESVFVNGKRVPVMALRHGDEVHLVDPALGDASSLRFEHRMGGVFVPPGASLATAWMAHSAFRDPAHGPERYGPGRALSGRDVERCRIVQEPGTARRLLIKVLGPVRSPHDGDQHFATLAALAGAPHAFVAPIVDGGLALTPAGPQKWSATAWVAGHCLRDRLADDGPLDLPFALRVLRDLACAVVHLHARGVIHRDVTAANVIIAPSGRAVLIDLGHALPVAAVPPPGPGVVGTPGYVAPEAVLGGQAPLSPAADVYGLAAVGYALFTGRPPATGQDVLEALAGSAAPPPRPRDLGIDLPPPLEAALLEALAAEPRARPSARHFERGLAFAAAALGLGDAP